MGINTYGKGFTKAMSMNEARSNGSLLPPILAVDFDGTLVQDRFPDIGPVNQRIWDAVVEAQKGGYRIILWSCRNGDALHRAVEFCANKDLHFDAINENIDEVKVMYGGDTRKVFADIYIDDRFAVLNPSGDFTRCQVEGGDPYDG